MPPKWEHDDPSPLFHIVPIPSIKTASGCSQTPQDPGFFPVVRAPARILALSHKGVVRLLELAFPHAIDKLQPDEGHRDGQKPVVVDDVPLEVRPGLLDRWWGFRYGSPH